MRQFEAWATAWREKYEADIFLRAAVSITVLLSGLVIGCVVLFWIVLNETNTAVVHAIVDNIQAIVAGGSPSTTLTTSINSIQGESVGSVFLGLVVMAVIFGWLFTRFMLEPTRNTLHYQKLFISNVAHELRTPLSVIKTSTEVALMDDAIAPAMRDTLGDIVRQLDRISEIINNLLSLNSYNRPERMQLHSVHVGDLVAAAVGRLEALARERGVEVAISVDSVDVVWGNATGLEQVIGNLIKNAISYTQKDSGGRVVVEVHPDYRGSIIFSVSDNGIGISRQDMAHIFEPFYRADTSRVRDINVSGSGLGLTIVSDIVRAHQGKVAIESARNRGTTVTVTLPMGATKGTAEHHASSEGDVSETSIDFSHGRIEADASAQSTQSAA